MRLMTTPYDRVAAVAPELSRKASQVAEEILAFFFEPEELTDEKYENYAFVIENIVAEYLESSASRYLAARFTREMEQNRTDEPKAKDN